MNGQLKEARDKAFAIIHMARSDDEFRQTLLDTPEEVLNVYEYPEGFRDDFLREALPGHVAIEGCTQTCAFTSCGPTVVV